MSFVNGQGRKVLVNTTVTASNGTLPTSLNFGTFCIAEFVGLYGLAKCDSHFAANLQLGYVQDSLGVVVVSSLVAISSGGTVNELAPGPYVNIGVTGIASNTPVRLYLTGLPIR